MWEVFDERVSTRKELMEYESSQRELQYRITSKQRELSRLAIISDSAYNKDKVGTALLALLPFARSVTSNHWMLLQTMAKCRRFIESSEKRWQVVSQRKVASEERMTANIAKLGKLESDFQASSLSKNDVLYEVLYNFVGTCICRDIFSVTNFRICCRTWPCL